MSSAEIPAELQTFIRENIKSLEQLEILLLLRKNPNRDWSVTEVADALRTSHQSVTAKMEELCSKLLLKKSEKSYRYAPDSREIAQTVDRLDKLYNERRVTVISLIYPPAHRDIEAFSDAFRIRKKKEED